MINKIQQSIRLESKKIMNKNNDLCSKLKAYIRNRITELRIAKGIAEREMSPGLGKSDSYIN